MSSTGARILSRRCRAYAPTRNTASLAMITTRNIFTVSFAFVHGYGAPQVSGHQRIATTQKFQEEDVGPTLTDKFIFNLLTLLLR